MPHLSPGDNGSCPYNCDAEGGHDCGADEYTRRRQHCGWLPEEEWLGERAELQDIMGCPVQLSELNVCPGWLVRQAAVQEGKLAAFALEKGALSQTFPRNENAIVDAAYIGVGAWKQFEAWEMKKARER